MGLFFIWFWLSLGGFAYQAITHHDWSRAFGTSWDQGAALLAVWLISIARSKLPSDQRGGE